METKTAPCCRAAEGYAPYPRPDKEPPEGWADPKDLRYALSGAGFTVEVYKGSPKGAFRIKPMDPGPLADAKHGWFATRLQTVRKAAADASPADFPDTEDLRAELYRLTDLAAGGPFPHIMFSTDKSTKRIPADAFVAALKPHVEYRVSGPSKKT